MTTDERAIQSILQQMEAAWNAYRSAGISELFAEDATFIHLFGAQLDGRTAIEGAHRVIFDSIYKGSHANFMLRSIRFVRPDVAVVFARMQLKFKTNNEAREIESRPTLIVVKEREDWQIVAFQNTRIAEVPTPAHAAALLAT
jgi:uncharacterized protein (TIGR02246 family)